MPTPSEGTYFWTPRGDATVVRNEGGEVTLAITLADYGPGTKTWDVDHYNSLKFFSLQCIVGFWRRAVYWAGMTRDPPSAELVAAVRGHAHAEELNALNPLKRQDDEGDGQARWGAFGAEAERLITDASLERRGRRRTLRFTVADPSWVTHLGPVEDWDLL